MPYTSSRTLPSTQVFQLLCCFAHSHPSERHFIFLYPFSPSNWHSIVGFATFALFFYHENFPESFEKF